MTSVFELGSAALAVLLGLAFAALETASAFFIVRSAVQSPCPLPIGVWYYLAATLMFAIVFGIAGTIHVLAGFKKVLVVVLLPVTCTGLASLGMYAFYTITEVKTECVVKPGDASVPSNEGVNVALSFMAGMDLSAALVLFLGYVHVVCGVGSSPRASSSRSPYHVPITV